MDAFSTLSRRAGKSFSETFPFTALSPSENQEQAKIASWPLRGFGCILAGVAVAINSFAHAWSSRGESASVSFSANVAQASGDHRSRQKNEAKKK